jgi:carboxyl-terminal processing protease
LGSQTFGKGSVQSVFPLDEGWALRLTTALYYTPKGRSIQATGIAPDITVAEGGETDFKRLKKEPLTFRERDLERHFENGSQNKKEGVSRPALDGPVDLLTTDPIVERAYQILRALEALEVTPQPKG